MASESFIDPSATSPRTSGVLIYNAPESRIFKSLLKNKEIRMDLGIKGRAAIVTGGSRGIGRETARQFLEEGVPNLRGQTTKDC